MAIRTRDLTPAEIAAKEAAEAGKPSKQPRPKPASSAPAKPKPFKRPRLEERHLTVSAQKPWEALGMSRRTWYRRQKEKRDG